MNTFTRISASLAASLMRASAEGEGASHDNRGANNDERPSKVVKIGVQARSLTAQNVNIDQSNNTYNTISNTVEVNTGKVGKLGPINEGQSHHLKRMNILGTISKYLRESEFGFGIRDAVVLSGIPGVGKTICAAQYIEVYGKDYDNVVWIPADSESSMANWMLTFAERLKVNTQGRSMRNIVDDVFSKLCSKSRTLVIFDNAECYFNEGGSEPGNGIEAFFPKALHPPQIQAHVIITTRTGVWSKHTKLVMPMKGFTDEECNQIITKRLESISDVATQYKKLADYFGNLPVALEAAVSAVLFEQQLYSDKKTTIVEFLKILEETSGDTDVAAEISGNVYQPLHKLYAVMFQRIKDQDLGIRALQVLDIMAFLSPSGVPTQLLHQLITSEDSPSREDRKAIQLLQSSSLIESNGNYLATNKVLQDLRWQSLSNSDNCTGFIEEISLRYKKTLKSTLSYANEGYDRYIDNSMWVSKKLLKYIHSDTVKSTLQELSCHVKGFNWRETLMIQDALRCQLCEEGKAHTEEALKAWNEIGYAHLIGGEYSEALATFEATLDAVGNKFGEFHKLALEIKENIGKTYLRQGKYKEASTLFQQVYDIRMEEKRRGRGQRTDASGHAVINEETRRTKLNEAIAKKKAGAHRAALKIGGELYEESVKNFGESHVETLKVKEHVADCLRRKGVYSEAITIYKEVEAQLGPILGRNDPKVLKVRHGLALTLILDSDYKKAFDIVSEICKLRSETYGDQHPDVLKCYYNMAVILNKVGFYKAAAEAFRENYETREKVIKDEHPSSVHSKEGLDRAEEDIAKCEKQLQVFENMCKKYLNFFGIPKDKKQVLLCDYGIAFCYRALGRYAEALVLYKSILEALYHNYGGEHWDVFVILRDLEESSILQDNFPDTREICEKVFGEAYEKLGPSAYQSNFRMKSKVFKHDDFDTFEEMYAEIYQKLFGVEDSDTVSRETCREEYTEISSTGSISMFKTLYLTKSFFTGIGISSDDIELF